MKQYDINNQSGKNQSKQTKEQEKKEKKLKRKVFTRNLSIVVLIIIIILLLLWRGCGGDFQEIGMIDWTEQEEVFEPTFEDEGIHTQTEQEEKEKAYVTMPFVDDFTVSSKNPYVILYSPIENEDLFYITYTFTDEDGDIIYESNLVKAGTQFDVNFKELLEVGEHIVTVQLSSMFCDTYKPANGITSDIGLISIFTIYNLLIESV